MRSLLTSRDHFASMRTPTGSVLPQEPAYRLLCRALEHLGPKELGLRVIQSLELADANQPCAVGISHLHALLGERGPRRRPD